MRNTLLAVLVCFGLTSFTQDAPKSEFYNNGNLKATYSSIENGLTKVVLYFEEGGIRETGYVLNNQRTGVWESFDRSGNKTSKGYYSDDDKVGTWTFWSATGQVYATVMYNQNSIVSYNVNDEVPTIAYTEDQ